MHALANGRGYLSLLERKQKRVEQDRINSENGLKVIVQQLMLCQQKSAELSRQINMSIQPGVVSRTEIYQRIRHQGVLLSRQQHIIHEIDELQEQQASQQQKIEQLRHFMTRLDKKHYNASFYLKKIQLALLRQADSRAEDDIQEIASYGWKIS